LASGEKEEVAHEKEESGLSKMLTKIFNKNPNLAKKYLDTLEPIGVTIEFLVTTLASGRKELLECLEDMGVDNMLNRHEIANELAAALPRISTA